MQSLIHRSFAFLMLPTILLSLPWAASCVTDTPELESLPPRDVTSLQVDPHGSIYLLDHARDEALKFDSDGNLLWTVSLTSSEGKRSEGQTLALVSGSTASLVVPSYTGFWSISLDGQKSLLCASPWGYTDRTCSIDGVGRFHFPDRRNRKVSVYNMPAPGTAITSDVQKNKAVAQSPSDCFTKPELEISGETDGPARFGDVYAVFGSSGGAPDVSQQRIWILDNTYTFNVFDQSGKFLYELRAPDHRNRSFTYVQGIEFDADKNAYVGCGETKNILKYDPNGKFLAALPLPKDCVQGLWGEGFDLGYGPDANLYCAGTNRLPGQAAIPVVSVLSTSGRLLKTIQLQVK